MCWACYTPLSGGGIAAPGTVAGRAGAPGATGAGAATIVADEGKKQIDPKIFGIAGLAVVGILVALFTNGVFSSSAPAPLDFSNTTTTSRDPMRSGGGAPVVVAPVVSSGVGNGGGGGGGGKVDPPPPAPYVTVVPPNASFATGVIGIVPVDGNVSPDQALNLARYARNQYSQSGPWKKMQIYVLANKAAGRDFATYQSRRRGETLYTSNFQELASSGLWGNVPACLITDGNRAQPFKPSQNPGSWWLRS